MGRCVDLGAGGLPYLPFAEVVGRLAEARRRSGALVVVVEDLHWADQSSRDLLRFLVARLRDEHVVVVASYRTDDLHRRHPLRQMLPDLVRLPQVERVELAPFDPGELSTYLRGLTGAPVAARRWRACWSGRRAMPTSPRS